MGPKSSIENPLLPQRTVNFASRRYKLSTVTGLLPWCLQPEVKEAPIVRHQGRWCDLLFGFNLAYGYIIFLPALTYVCHGILFLGWGRIQLQFCLLSLGALGLPIIGSLGLRRERECLELARESWKHINYLQRYFRAEFGRTPKLVLRSQMAMEAISYMTYSNTLSVALATIFVPWLPLALSNDVELVLGFKLAHPWKAVAKIFDFGAMCYMGHQCAEFIFMPLMVMHCFCVCNTVVMRDLMSKNPQLLRPAVADQCQCNVIIGIWRRISILNISFNRCFGSSLMSVQTAIIIIASGGVFAAIKTEGFMSVGLGSVAFFVVLMLFAILRYTSLLGEAMVEMKAKLERECRGNPLLRRQIRSLRPAFITAGSFYYIDKGCILTCFTIIVDNVVNALMMAKM